MDGKELCITLIHGSKMVGSFMPLPCTIGIPSNKVLLLSSATSKKSQNVYKSCPKMIALENLKIMTPLQKLVPKNVGDLGWIIFATGFKKLLKVQ